MSETLAQQATRAEGHGPQCYTMPECIVCRRRKAPKGRSVPMEMYSSLCNSGCAGYYSVPMPGHEWPEESPWRKSVVEGETR